MRQCRIRADDRNSRPCLRVEGAGESEDPTGAPDVLSAGKIGRPCDRPLLVLLRPRFSRGGETAGSDSDATYALARIVLEERKRQNRRVDGRARARAQGSERVPVGRADRRLTDF